MKPLLLLSVVLMPVSITLHTVGLVASRIAEVGK